MVAEPVSRGKAPTIRHPGAIRSALWAPTAGNEKTVTEINLPPPEEIPVSTLPSSVLQIATEPGQPGFEGVDLGERRIADADLVVELHHLSTSAWYRPGRACNRRGGSWVSLTCRWLRVG